MTPSAKKTGLYIWCSVLACGVLVGLYGTIHMVTQGHTASFNLTREVPWGILISSYEYFMAASAGLLLLANFGYVFGSRAFKLFARQAIGLSMATMLIAFMVMGAEINHPLRMMFYALTSPNFASPLIWVGLAYCFFGLMLVLQLLAETLGRDELNAKLGVFGLIAAIAVLTVMGSILGVAKARPLWYGGYLPLYFGITGVISGGALLSVVAFFAAPFRSGSEEGAQALEVLGRFLRFALLTLVVMVIWKLVPGLYGMPPGKYEAVMTLLSGPLAVNFWVGEVLFGLALPLLILFGSTPCTPLKACLAGLSATIGVFVMRYDLIVAGQVVPVRSGSSELVNGLLQYSPSGIEVSLVVGAASFGLLLYGIGESLLTLFFGDS